MFRKKIIFILLISLSFSLSSCQIKNGNTDIEPISEIEKTIEKDEKSPTQNNKKAKEKNNLAKEKNNINLEKQNEANKFLSSIEKKAKKDINSSLDLKLLKDYLSDLSQEAGEKELCEFYEKALRIYEEEAKFYEVKLQELQYQSADFKLKPDDLLSNAQKRLKEELNKNHINFSSEIYAKSIKVEYDFSILDDVISKLPEKIQNFHEIYKQDNIKTLSGLEVGEKFTKLASYIKLREDFESKYKDSVFSKRVYYSLWNCMDKFINNTDYFGDFHGARLDGKFIKEGNKFILNEKVLNVYKKFLNSQTRLYDGFKEIYQNLSDNNFKWEENDPSLYKMYDLSFVNRVYGIKNKTYTNSINANPKFIEPFEIAISKLFEKSNKIKLLMRNRNSGEIFIYLDKENIANYTKAEKIEIDGQKIEKLSHFTGKDYIMYFPKFKKALSFKSHNQDMKLFDFKRMEYRNRLDDKNKITYIFENRKNPKKPNDSLWLNYKLDSKTYKLESITIYRQDSFKKSEEQVFNINEITADEFDLKTILKEIDIKEQDDESFDLRNFLINWFFKNEN